jgi:hypothetical protein
MYRKSRHLQIGDRVEFSDSNVHASGVVIEDLGPDYVKVQWLDCPIATTHRRHALGFQRVMGLSEWTSLVLGTARRQQPQTTAGSC